MARRETESGPGEAAAAFDLLGHETRLAIVEALADARRVGWQPRGLSFAELRRAVGAGDAGRFNYHLDALLGTFVDKRDGEYVLTNAGLEIEGTVREGRLGDAAESRSGTIGRSCPVCPEPIEATYEAETLRFSCPAHGDFFATGLPPAAVRGRDWETVVRLGLSYSRWEVQKARNGACPHCWGRMSARAPIDDPSALVGAAWRDLPESDIEQVIAAFECGDCGLIFFLPVSACVASLPAVVSYYHERGTDPTDAWIFGLDLFTGANGRVVGEDPTRIEVVVAAEGADEGLVVTLDGEADVVSVERRTDVEIPRPSGD